MKSTEPQTITVKDCQLRVVRFYGGQRMETRLSAGTYRIGDEVTISGRWFDPSDAEFLAIELWGNSGIPWFVHPAMLTKHMKENQ